MTDSATAETLRVRRMQRRSRWQAALFEGTGAALFIAIAFRDGLTKPIAGGPGYVLLVSTAFGAVAVVAILLWPMTIKKGGFSPGRVTLFGILVVLLGSYLWLLIMSIASMRPFGLSPLLHLLSSPARLLEMFGRIAEGMLAGVLFFGIVTLPIGVGIAWTVAIWNNSRT